MKKFAFFIAVLCTGMSISAQVGIGTENPDASAILELDSDSQGMLTPRMTSAQRMGIASPAEGLMVYDTDEDLFYYYTTGTWTPLETGIKRDNYKLVKSIADLADELVAGGGSNYLLSPNYVYEINGTIFVDYPININDAYVMGEDSVEDRLVNATGTALFTGNKGGSLRRFLIVGNGNDIFNITGSGTENLFSLSVTYTNASSVGTISNMNYIYFSTATYQDNFDGFEFTDISSLYMGMNLWATSNQGTFLTMSGSFDEVQIGNSRIQADTGETGIDVSANPTVNVSASLSQINFDGDGTLVNGYTTNTYPGYNFSKEWYVESQGIKRETDDNASANFYYNGSLTTGFTQTITNGTAVEVQGSGSFSSNELFRFSVSNGGNRLTYEGLKNREFLINSSLSVRVNFAAGDFYAFVIAKNGTVVTESNSVVYIQGDNQIQSVALNANVNLDSGDYIEVYVQRLIGTGTDTLVVFSENLSIN